MLHHQNQPHHHRRSHRRGLLKLHSPFLSSFSSSWQGTTSLLLFFIIFSSLNLFATVVGDDDEFSCTQGGHGPSDMIAHGTMNGKYMWYKRGKRTYVPVFMSSGYSPKEHDTILGGLKEIESKTCIDFDVYDDEDDIKESDYVFINKNTNRGCYSYIGRIGGKQDIGLPIGCISHRTAMHEMLHALGFRHEHVRHDRDDYVQVMWENIKEGRESNFKKRNPSDLVSGPYDYDSIMHYERNAFSKNGQQTIKPLKSSAKIGVYQALSYWDAKKVNIVYKCGGDYYSSADVDAVMEHSPSLLRSAFHDDEFDSLGNDSSLPIAEFDDFNNKNDDNHGPPRPPPHGHRHRGHQHPRFQHFGFGGNQFGNELGNNENEEEEFHGGRPPRPPPPPRPKSSPFSGGYDEEDEEAAGPSRPPRPPPYSNNNGPRPQGGKHGPPRHNYDERGRENDFLSFVRGGSGRSNFDTPSDDEGHFIHNDFYDI